MQEDQGQGWCWGSGSGSGAHHSLHERGLALVAPQHAAAIARERTAHAPSARGLGSMVGLALGLGLELGSGLGFGLVLELGLGFAPLTLTLTS